jgi:hypothetical protein
MSNAQAGRESMEKSTVVVTVVNSVSQAYLVNLL